MEVNKIYCGDCLDVMKTFPDNCIDLTVTSPPYDNLRTYNGYTFDFEGIAQQLYRVTKKGGVVVWVVGDATINGSETGTSFKQALYFMTLGFSLYDTMIYGKKNTPPLNHPRYEQAFEYMFVLSKNKPKSVNLLQEKCLNAGKLNNGTVRNCGSDNLVEKHGVNKKCKKTKPLDNLWFYSVGCDRENKGRHPAIFPLKLAEHHILSWSNKGDIVLDPFCGSGTTCKMAVENHRNYIGIEISEEYIPIIKQRIKNAEPQLF